MRKFKARKMLPEMQLNTEEIAWADEKGGLNLPFYVLHWCNDFCLNFYLNDLFQFGLSFCRKFRRCKVININCVQAVAFKTSIQKLSFLFVMILFANPSAATLSS